MPSYCIQSHGVTAGCQDTKLLSTHWTNIPARTKHVWDWGIVPSRLPPMQGEA